MTGVDFDYLNPALIISRLMPCKSPHFEIFLLFISHIFRLTIQEMYLHLLTHVYQISVTFK